MKRVSWEGRIRSNLEYLSFLNPYLAPEQPPLASFVFMYEYFIQTPLAYRADLSGGRLKDFKSEDFDPLGALPSIAPYLFAPEVFLEDTFYSNFKAAKLLGEMLVESLNKLSTLFTLHRDILPKAFFGLHHSRFYSRDFMTSLARAAFSLVDQQEGFSLSGRLHYKNIVTRKINSYLPLFYQDEKVRYFSTLELAGTSFYDFFFIPGIMPTEEEWSIIYQNAYKVLTIDCPRTRPYKKGRTPLHLVAERAQYFKEDPHYKDFFDPTSAHFRFNNGMLEEEDDAAATSGGGGGGGGASVEEDDWGVHHVVGALKKKEKKTSRKKGKPVHKRKGGRSRDPSFEQAAAAPAEASPREEERTPEERKSPMRPLAKAEIPPQDALALFAEIMSHTESGIDSQHALAHVLGLGPGTYEVRKGIIARDGGSEEPATEGRTEERRRQTHAWLQKNFSTKQQELLLRILHQDIRFAKYQDVVILFNRFTGAEVRTKSGSHRDFMFRALAAPGNPEPRLIKMDEFVEPHRGGVFGPAAIRDAATMFTRMLSPLIT